jgi:hypothetical protein
MQQAGVTRRLDDGSYAYAPAQAELRELIDALADTYAHDLLGITDLIHSRIDKRAQTFADAFRWKKEGD